MEIAVYGKGGIGKSTVSANLSAAIAGTGKRVLQVGCDPKHDSTRLLMHGDQIPTVLNYLKNTDQNHRNLEDVLKIGWRQVGCVEAGGPKPGVGCAGRGIISSFEFLNEYHVKENYDYIVYDVLGDVVCGGFAVPVRREYADMIFLVTSGEYMALYAANNILRGIRNYDGDVHRRVAGIIYNERKLEDEDARVRRFAQAVGLPICAKVPRSDAFAKAEASNCTVMELQNGSDGAEQLVFEKIARQILEHPVLHKAAPLSDEELEAAVLGTRLQCSLGIAEKVNIGAHAEMCTSENADAERKDATENNHASPVAPAAMQRMPLYGCAFNGAATTAIHLTDAIVIAHSPKSCAFFSWQNISSPGRKNLFNRGILMPSAISPNFECTNMDSADVIFGGMDTLRNAVDQAIARRPGAVVIISSCVSGIIGDDIRALEELSTPELPVIAIHADGDIAGDYMEGIRMCMHTAAEKIIDPNRSCSGKKVNLIGEAGVSNNLESNYRIMRRMLEALGVTVNCRFLGDTTVRELQGFLEAPLNILAADNADCRALKQFLSNRYACNFFDEAFPIGFAATRRFLLKLGQIFDCADAARQMIAAQEEEYRQEIEALRPVLSGKKIFLTTINTNMDWLLDTLVDLEMEVQLIAVLNYLHQEVKITDHPERYTIDAAFDWTSMEATIEQLQPDIVLSNYATQKEGAGYLVDAMPMVPAVGFASGLDVTKRWAGLLTKQRKGAWMHDRALYEKYFS